MGFGPNTKPLAIGDCQYRCAVSSRVRGDKIVTGITVFNMNGNVVASGQLCAGELIGTGDLLRHAAQEMGLLPKPEPRAKAEPPPPEPATIEVTISAPLDEAQIGLLTAEALRTEAPSLVAEKSTEPPAEEPAAFTFHESEDAFLEALSTEMDTLDLGPSADED